MTKISVDIVDSYVYRRMQGVVQFLLLQRHPDVSLGGSWHAIHGKIEARETAFEAAKRTVLQSIGANVVDSFSADYINQFFDHTSDAIILAPVFAFTIPPTTAVVLSAEYIDFAWCDTEEATARLLFSGQRWAVRHIEEIIGMGGDDSEFYRIQ